MERPPEAPASYHEPELGSSSQTGLSSASSAMSYSRDGRTQNQTPSTPLLFGPNDIPPDVPPPSYEEATGISPTAPTPASSLATASASGARPNNLGRLPPLPPRTQSNASLAIPGAYPRPISSGPHGGGRGTGAASAAGNRRTSAGSANAVVMPSCQHTSGVYGDPKAGRRPSTGGASSSAVGSSASRTTAPGSVPRGRQFPAAFNLYGDNWSRTYMLGEHQQTPLYAVRMRPTWQMSNPVVALHNGPNPETAPLLAAIDHSSMSDSMSVTLPPPLTYTGTGSTAVRLDLVLSWSHHYTFTMEVGTDLQNVHMETFEWRHSYGNAVAALGGAREGWKLVRMSTQPLPGAPRPQPAPGFMSSDGREVVALYTDARMSITKQLKFAFVGTGRTGALGERWAVMATMSALGIWEKEEAVKNHR